MKQSLQLLLHKLLPDTLFWRLIWVLCAGLLAALSFTLFINYEDRGELLLSTQRSQSALRIANTIQLLDSLNTEEQKRIISIINVPPQQVWLSNTPLSTESETQPTTATSTQTTAERLFTNQILNYLDENKNILVTQTATATNTPPQAIQPYNNTETHRDMRGMGMRRGMRNNIRSGMQRSHHMNTAALSNTPHTGSFFLVQAQLENGLWVIFDTYTPQTAATLPIRLLTTLGILFASVIILSFIAVRWLTRPLHQLAHAANALGQNIEHPPLQETGPREIRQAAHAFNTMQQCLQQATQEKNHMLAAISHDLKTPITRLRLRAEMLEDDELRQRFEQDLKEMELMVSEALDLMKGLDTTQQKHPINIMALLESLETDYADTNKTITIEGHTEKPYPGFAPLLKRCLVNLLDNAIFYGQQAHIQIDDNPTQLTLNIQDQGPGIPEEEQQKAFQPFYRIEPSRNRQTGGTGLGLYIARKIAQLHGGQITLQNLQQGGLQVTLHLPRASL